VTWEAYDISGQPDLVARLNDEDRVWKAELQAGERKREELGVERQAPGA
jgi:hypothetical protein